MVVGLGSKESLTQNKKDKKMNIKTPAVLLLCLSMGCSTTRSAAGGFSLATGIATGIGAIALTGVAASNDYSGGSVLPMVGSIAGSALISTTFSTLAYYLLQHESSDNNTVTVTLTNHSETTDEFSQRTRSRRYFENHCLSHPDSSVLRNFLSYAGERFHHCDGTTPIFRANHF